jgi:hypothetical protein
MKKQKLVTFEEAKPAKAQHTTPCSDCPWRRDALPGWLGGNTPEEWVQIAHSDGLVECHTLLGAQCAGIAVYRRNVCKRVDPPNMTLEADKDAVFGWPTEFVDHHNGTFK